MQRSTPKIICPVEQPDLDAINEFLVDDHDDNATLDLSNYRVDFSSAELIGAALGASQRISSIELGENNEWAGVFIKHLIYNNHPNAFQIITSQQVFINTFIEALQKSELPINELVFQIIIRHPAFLAFVCQSENSIYLFFKKVSKLAFFEKYLDEVLFCLANCNEFKEVICGIKAQLQTNMTDVLLFFPWDALTKLVIMMITNKCQGDTKQAQAMQILLNFANNYAGKLQYKSLSKLAAVYQLFSLVINPNQINQALTNLCGPVAVMIMLFKAHPDRMIDIALQLITQGVANCPLFKPTKDSLEKDKSLDLILLKAFKNADLLLPYTTNKLFGKIDVETLLGVTAPKTLSKWLAKFGFTDIQEAIVVQTTNEWEVPYLLRGLLGGIYSGKYHKTFDDLEKNFYAALNAFNNEHMLLMFFNINPGHEQNNIGPIRNGHYVYVQALKLVKIDNLYLVNLTYASSGKTISVDFTLQDLLSIYRGFIAARPTKQHDLRHVAPVTRISPQM